MKILKVLVLVFGFLISVPAQGETKHIKLSGVTFDENGSIIIGTNVSAINKAGREYRTETNNDGRFELVLPVGRYEIAFDARGFKKTIYTEVRIVNSTYGKINWDVILEVAEPTIYAPVYIDRRPVETKTVEVSNKIFERPLENFSKEQNKSKRKKINNNQ